MIWGLRHALNVYVRMPGMKYRLTEEGQGIMPLHKLEARKGSGEFVTIGAVFLMRGDARDFLDDASLGAFIRELLKADRARKKGKKNA